MSNLPTPYYEDGGITLYHGDCLELLPGISEKSVDFVFTDPPYGHNNNNNGDLAHRREEALGLVKRGVDVAGDARPIANDGEEANGLFRSSLVWIRRAMKPGSCCCCCCGGGGPDPQFARWSLWMDEAIGFKHAVVWNKGGLGMGWHYRRNYELVLIAQKPGAKCKWYGGNDVPNVVDLSGIKPKAHEHPTPKPVALVRHFIRLHTESGDLVLDPFAGAGTTMVAAALENRRAIGIELEERWCELAAKRLSQKTFQWDPT